MGALHHRRSTPSSVADEFLALMDLKRRVEARLGELVVILDDREPLPLSGLKPVRRGAFLFKGGRIA